MINKKTISPPSLFFLLSTICLLVSGCRENKLKIDTDKITINPVFQRFDQDLFNLPDPVSANDVESLRKKYPAFFDLFCTRIIRIPSETDSLIALNLSHFTSDRDVRSIHAKTAAVFPKLDWLENDLTEMLKY